jgi:dual specificity MAP kinase phosphatase
MCQGSQNDGVFRSFRVVSGPEKFETEIVPGKLYLSSAATARDVEFIKENKIGAILSVMLDPLPEAYVKECGVEYLHIEALDNIQANLKQHFGKAIEFIENHETVLVHCHAGISRSATLCAAYLIKQHQWGATETVRFLQSKRQQVAPNFSFLGQLEVFSRSLIEEPEVLRT